MNGWKMSKQREKKKGRRKEGSGERGENDVDGWMDDVW